MKAIFVFEFILRLKKFYDGGPRTLQRLLY